MSKLVYWIRYVFEESFRRSVKNTPVIVKYARAELGPPKLSEFRIAKESFKNIVYSARSGAWKDMKVRDIFLNTMVGLEVIMWFFIGEIIGRRHIIGYKLKY